MKSENPPVSTPSATQDRLYSVDAFRGFTMFCMFAGPFGLDLFEHHWFLGHIVWQLDHAEWTGMHFWDLIQPFFMFIVGVVMPYSFARRWARGETWNESLMHVLRRAALLIGWGLVARSIGAGRPNLDLINVLAQIAFTYTVAFLILQKSWKFQAGVALLLLVAHTLLYLFVRVDGVEGPWVRNANIGQALDLMILGKTWGGSYATVNCVSSAFNTILGVLTGRLLFSKESLARKTQILAYSGLGLVVFGLALHPFIPINKKIWTASFAILSGGITVLALLLFYWVCDVWKRRAWAGLFVMIGANSIFIYLFHEILGRWMRHTAPTFTNWAEPFVGAWAPFTAAWLAIALQVYVCRWLYQRRIFFKL